MIQRFRNLRTSQLISLKFTLSMIAAIFGFALIVNASVFILWYEKTKTFLDDITNYRIANDVVPETSIFIDNHIQEGMAISLWHRDRGRRPRGPKKLPPIEILPLISPKAQTILDQGGYFSITQYDDEWLMYRILGPRLIIVSIDDHMFLQRILLRSSIFLIIAFALMSYGVSLLFVKSALAQLHRVIKQIHNKDIINHFSPLSTTGPEDDEIRILVTTLNTALERIHHDAQTLKNFIAHAAHELKTPLMTMSSITDLATQQSKTDTLPRQLKPLLHAQNELISQLLLLAKYEHQTTESLPRHTEDLHNVINPLIDTLTIHYQHKKITIQKDFADHVSVSIHRPSFEILVKNLLDNAFHYTPEHGNINVTLTQDYLQITDTGSGIAPEHLEHIWEKFWRADSSQDNTQEQQHYGLGLSLCQTIAHLHDFKLRVESTLRQGTTFTLSFS